MLPPKLLSEAISVSQVGIPRPDVVTKLEQNSALGEVLAAAGFRAVNANPRCTEEDVRVAMESTGRAVAHKLERYLPPWPPSRLPRCSACWAR